MAKLLVLRKRMIQQNIGVALPWLEVKSCGIDKIFLIKLWFLGRIAESAFWIGYYEILFMQAV